MNSDDRFIPLSEVCKRLSLSKTQIYRLLAAGDFPQSIALGQRRIAFVEREIVAWMAGRAERRSPRATTIYDVAATANSEG